MKIAIWGKYIVAAVSILFSVQVCEAGAQPSSCIDEIKTTSVNSTEIHYFECGDGAPVVFVHGGLGDYRNWIVQANHLSTNYHIISYSRRYHYQNKWPQKSVNFGAA
ncbi:MAG: alpha/beta hydrolase, partial [Balneolaceae bacterium]|nr:alpha/beta hydrolase [Balneolaceae bacterium]